MMNGKGHSMYKGAMQVHCKTETNISASLDERQDISTSRQCFKSQMPNEHFTENDNSLDEV